jgi:hypothetical protein
MVRDMNGEGIMANNVHTEKSFDRSHGADAKGLT